MNKIIVVSNPPEANNMYISEVCFKPREDHSAAMCYRLTTYKSHALCFDNDDELQLAFNIVNLYNKKLHKSYKLTIEEVS